MKNNFLRAFAFGALASLTVFSFGQSNSEAVQYSRNIHKLLVLNQFLPVLMTGPQIKALLPAIEHARGAETKLQGQELDILSREDKDITKALREAEGGKRITTGKEATHLYQALSALNLARQNLLADETEHVRLAIDKLVTKKVMDRGQVTVMAKTVDPRWIDDKVDLKKFTEEDRVHLFIRTVLLDPIIYDYLVKRSREDE